MPQVLKMSRSAFVLAVSGVLFAVIAVLRFIVDEAAVGVGLFCVLPIALVAMEFGVRGGQIAATAALALNIVWAIANVKAEEIGVLGLASRGTVFYLLGYLVGKYAHGSLARYSPHALALNRELGKALSRGAIKLHYQPIADARTRKVFCAEALARWEHPQRGRIPPDEFITTAEQGEVIWPLTIYTIEMAADQLEAWESRGIDIEIAVNLSTASVLDERLPGELQRIVTEHDVKPERLKLEITETAIMADPGKSAELIERITETGVRLIALDDFGTGYSSLARLEALPISILKIDRAFVSALADGGTAETVKAIIALGHALGLTIIAEGVEDGRTWQTMASLGCDAIQGYCLAHPAPAHEFERWLRRREAPALAAGV